jgi:beta-lactamase class A
LKKTILLLWFIILSAGFAFGLTVQQQNNIEARLTRLTAARESRVGAAFIDLKTGWQFTVNGTEEFPTASVIKVAVMATAYHLSELGELDLGEKLTMKESDRLGGSGVLQWMKAGRSYTIWNLCRMMITLSDNIATKMLVDRIGKTEINRYMTEISLPHIIVKDHTMLNEPPSTEVNSATPLEMAYLLEKIKERQGFSLNSANEMLAFMRNQRYHWGIWRGVNPGTIVADKTGNLTGILNDVGVIYTSRGEYVLSLFTRNMKKHEARILINDISRAVYEEYTGEKVVGPKQLVRKKKIIKTRRIIKKKIIKRKLSRRSFVKSRPLSGHRGKVLNHKSHSSLRRSPARPRHPIS